MAITTFVPTTSNSNQPQRRTRQPTAVGWTRDPRRFTWAALFLPASQFVHFHFHADQCESNIAMAEEKEFDLFAYIFKREGEENRSRTEPQEEDSPLDNVTMDSDEDDASNSMAAATEQGSQPDQLQEAEINKCESNVVMAEEKEFDLFAYISNREGETDQPSTKRQEEHLPITDFTADSDEDATSNSTAALIQPNQPQSSSRLPRKAQPSKLQEPVRISKPWTSWPSRILIENFSIERDWPPVAKEVLALYTRPQNKKKQKVHLCSHFALGKCNYFSTSTSAMKMHMTRRHSKTLPMIKIIGYPGQSEKTSHTYQHMTWAELKRERSEVADEILKYYYENNYRGKVHLCGSCNFYSYNGTVVLTHVASHHPPTTRVYKISEYPPLPLD